MIGENTMKYDFEAELKKRYSNDPTYEKVTEILNSDENKLGNDFLSLRTSLDMSQEKTAEYLNISSLNYIEIESGTSNQSLEELKSYFKRLQELKS